MNPNVGLVIFSAIEAAGWVTLFAITGVITTVKLGAIVFTVALAYGILEHLVAYNTGKGGRPFFQFPLKP